jgi:dTDP-4-amino-4,6-dideoxygalactose transaminase
MTEAPARTLPFVDLSHANAAIERDVLAAPPHSSRWGFNNGPHVRRFKAFSAYCGALNASAWRAASTRSGSLIAAASSRRRGDRPSDLRAFEAVSQAGATPGVADVSEHDYNLDPDAAAAALGPRTRCVLPVHLYGQMADMRRLSHLAGRHDLVLVEDACQAHGAERDDLRPGEVAAAAAFSFYPTKTPRRRRRAHQQRPLARRQRARAAPARRARALRV